MRGALLYLEEIASEWARTWDEVGKPRSGFQSQAKSTGGSICHLRRRNEIERRPGDHG